MDSKHLIILALAVAMAAVLAFAFVTWRKGKKSEPHSLHAAGYRFRTSSGRVKRFEDTGEADPPDAASTARDVRPPLQPTVRRDEYRTPPARTPSTSDNTPVAAAAIMTQNSAACAPTTTNAPSYDGGGGGDGGGGVSC